MKAATLFVTAHVNSIHTLNLRRLSAFAARYGETRRAERASTEKEKTRVCRSAPCAACFPTGGSLRRSGTFRGAMRQRRWGSGQVLAPSFPFPADVQTKSQVSSPDLRVSFLSPKQKCSTSPLRTPSRSNRISCASSIGSCSLHAGDGSIIRPRELGRIEFFSAP
jgi:hypothetical protein